MSCTALAVPAIFDQGDEDVDVIIRPGPARGQSIPVIEWHPTFCGQRMDGVRIPGKGGIDGADGEARLAPAG